MIILWA